MHLGLWRPMLVQIILVLFFFNVPTTPLPLPVSTSQNNQNTGEEMENRSTFCLCRLQDTFVAVGESHFFL